ncbi:MAG: hypothetical protein ABSF55_03625 [Candidatus Staskawiczbacteria bacterium]|jgi:hypothetical protein
MMHEENHEGHEDCGCRQMHGPMKKEFKLAMLEKKEKIIQAKLDFIGKMKEMIKKMPEDKG